MVSELRTSFNQNFTREQYREVINQLKIQFPDQLDFRVSESPVFLPRYFKDRLLEVGESLVDQILKMSDDDLSAAIPAHVQVHADGSRPNLMCIDFAICQDERGELVPALIELQACSTLNYYQLELARAYRQHYDIDPDLTCFFSGLNEKTFLDRMRKIILGNHAPEAVALVDYKPARQKTKIDFAATHKHLGIPILCLTDLEEKDHKIYYESGGEKKVLSRIYNRFIFDEIDRESRSELPIDLSQDLELEWVVHPNWFFKISKHTMPRLRHAYAPETYYASDFPSEKDLSEFVLKPLFSFSGQGVILDPKEADIDGLTDTKSHILQKKVRFAPLFSDTSGERAMAEIRMIYSWAEGEDRPIATLNLVRMTKSAMSNVDHNKADLMWTGGSIAFFEK